MNKFRQLSLRIILPAILLVVFVILQGTIFFFEYRHDQHKLYVKAEQDIKGIAGHLQTGLSNSLMRLEKAQAQDLVSNAALNENVQTIAVVDRNQQIVLSNQFREKYMFAKIQLQQYDGALLERVINDNELIVKYLKHSQELVVYAPLQMISKGNSLNRKFNGVIFIRYSLNSAYSELAYDAAIALIKIFLILIFTLLLLIYFINRLITSPLKRLAQTTALSDMTNHMNLEQSGLGEIGLLQRSFARLSSEVTDNINKLSATEQRWLYALSGARDGVWDWDMEKDQVYYSLRWKEMLGYHKDDIKNDIAEWEDRIHPDDLFNTFKDLRAHFIGRNSFFENTHRLRCHNNDYRWILSRGQIVSWDINGNPLRIIGTHTDVTPYKEMHEKIILQSQFDEVTALPNRTQLMSHISLENKRAQKSGMAGAVILIDCKQYQTINDLQGLYKGDELLYLIARRLEENKSEADFVAHLQGGEFVAILPELNANQEHAAEFALNFATKLDIALKEPFKIDDEQLILSCTFGISLFPSENNQANDLLRQSVMAMKNAQNSQFANISFFAKEIEDKIHQNHVLQGQIHIALENDEFSLNYQPRVDVNGNLLGAEALARWFRGEQGWINPSDFIPVAEDSDLIIPLGEWVIENAFLQLKNWMIQGLPKHFETLSINISAKQLLQPDFFEVIEKLVLKTRVDAKLIEFEITESVFSSHMELIVKKLNKLRKLGFRFAIDDFGTGYSSFSYLSQLPVSTLKIDQMFIRHLLEQENNQVIVTAIINMGKSLNLEVVAEGIENKQQLDFLIEKGCHQFQGYFVGTPLANRSFQTVLANEKLKLNKLES
ncbi:bifunctional diguanylate cyclase/phosphodiesterase [Psychromonas sp. RZ22]|uniref:putative bifunctional diguanylate cyclase/phosphodiesterase n=1 Tax=Psychromonas algarum TaxID=2555643 RepID=UPI001068B3A5|nr:bifunctional diguanylate cyclase/phosphodiesterase [Psychromonas sp. RZ22]TEW55238.1 bifunctional diguanylate cyclase/phosphodiesterase [Psychromonas sp. RZ22]